MLRRSAICLALPLALLLAGCGAEPVWAPDDAVARARYVSGEQPSITLFTGAVINGITSAAYSATGDAKIHYVSTHD